MAFEKRWEAITQQLLVANGTVDGIVTLSSTTKFKVKQEVKLRSNVAPTISLEVKRVISSTQLLVGPKGTNLQTVMDISAYTVADSSTIEAPEQQRPSIPLQEHERAVFEEEPTIAKRVFIVDELGQPRDEDNPLPVLATVSDNAPQNVFIFRKAYSTAGAEESQTIPDNTRKLFISVVGKDAKLRVSFNQGGTIDGGSETYTTVEIGNSYDREGLKLTGKTLYFQANKDNKVIEIEAWV